MESKFIKNVFNKEAGFLANSFGVVAAIWILPIVIVYLFAQLLVSATTSIYNKIKKKNNG